MAWCGSYAEDDETCDRAHKSLNFRQRALDHFETRLLLRAAARLAVEVPDTECWWRDDSAYGLSKPTRPLNLTEVGQRGVRRMIQDERRRRVEWWLTKLFVPVFQIAIPILALVVGLLSVGKSR